MPLKINSASGSITLTAEDGSGNADVTIPRGGFVGSLSDLSVTATAAEINKLDGVTATTAELNHVDGVTSNIQTQLDAKGTVSSLSDLGVTATAAEINKLDGVTATTAELNYNDISTLGTVQAGKVVTASTTGDVTWPDSEKAKFGNSGDLQIYHDGSDSQIWELGTGDLKLTGFANVKILAGTLQESMANFAADGAVTLYYNNSQKFETTATGVNISGGLTLNGALDIDEVYEKVTTQTSTSGTITFNTILQGVEYYTANQTANRTINFSNVNSNISAGQSVTCTVLMTQGSTAYYLNAYQVDGTAVTPKWSGGTAPSAGNASGIDVYTFTIIKTADATFTVLASVTQYA